MQRNMKTLALIGAAVCLSSAAMLAHAATRVGLFYSQEEISAWQSRANSGPYKIQGDVSQGTLAAGAAGNYSPGQWTSVENNALSFKNAPDLDRYTNLYTGAGCHPHAASPTPYDPGDANSKMVKAAFYYLIKNDATYAAAVRNELNAYAAEPKLNFADTTRWCPGDIGDQNPGFLIAQWLTRLLVSYDILVAKGYIAGAEKTKIDTWFKNAALYMRSNYDPYLDTRFVARANGDYTLSSAAKTETLNPGTLIMQYKNASGEVVPYASARHIHKVFNNRYASMATFVGLYGVYANDAALEASGTRFWKEWMMFGVRPDGVPTELFRSTDSSNPFNGPAYAWHMVGEYSLLADAKARRGNPELYTYETRNGSNLPEIGQDNTVVPASGTPKNLLSVISKLLELQNERLIAYNFSEAKKSTVAPGDYWRYRIDGRANTTTTNKTYVFDTWAVIANRWYKNASVIQNYRRDAAGTARYPQYASSSGAFSGYTNAGATVAAPLFQYHGLDHIAVYPVGTFLQVDFGAAPTETGFVKQGAASATHWSSQGNVTLTISGQTGFWTGGAQADSGAFSYAQLYNDFVFHNNSGTITFNLSGPGIRANTRYEVTVYSFDDDNSGTVAFSPAGSTTGGSASISWSNTALPTSNEQYGRTLLLTSDTAGNLSFKAAPGSWAIRVSGLKLAYAP